MGCSQFMFARQFINVFRTHLLLLQWRSKWGDARLQTTLFLFHLLKYKCWDFNIKLLSHTAFFLLLLFFPHCRPNLNHSLPVVLLLVVVTAYETQSAPGSCSLFKPSLPKLGPDPCPGALPPPCLSAPLWFFSLPPGTAGRPWELLSAQLQEHRLYSRKPARVCLSSPRGNNSHVENLLQLHCCTAVVHTWALPPDLVGCSSITLKKKKLLCAYHRSACCQVTATEQQACGNFCVGWACRSPRSKAHKL